MQHGFMLCWCCTASLNLGVLLLMFMALHNVHKALVGSTTKKFLYTRHAGLVCSVVPSGLREIVVCCMRQSYMPF